MALNIRVYRSGFDKMYRKYKTKLTPALEKATRLFANDAARSLMNTLVRKPLATQSRITSANRIKAVQKGKTSFHVMIPASLDKLDSMQPHYVSLKRGRAIVRWVRRNYTATPRPGSLGSRVRFGRGQSIKGSLYVQPIPFVFEGYNKTRPTLQSRLRTAIKEAIGVN